MLIHSFRIEEQGTFMKSIGMYRTAYLNRSATRLLEYVLKLFPNSSSTNTATITFPTNDEITNFVNILANELELSSNIINFNNATNSNSNSNSSSSSGININTNSSSVTDIYYDL